MGNSNLYSKQRHCCIPVVASRMTVLKLRFDWCAEMSHQLDQAFCPKSPDPFLSQRVGSRHETNLLASCSITKLMYRHTANCAPNKINWLHFLPNK